MHLHQVFPDELYFRAGMSSLIIFPQLLEFECAQPKAWEYKLRSALGFSRETEPIGDIDICIYWYIDKDIDIYIYIIYWLCTIYYLSLYLSICLSIYHLFIYLSGYAAISNVSEATNYIRYRVSFFPASPLYGFCFFRYTFF